MKNTSMDHQNNDWTIHIFQTSNAKKNDKNMGKKLSFLSFSFRLTLFHFFLLKTKPTLFLSFISSLCLMPKKIHFFLFSPSFPEKTHPLPLSNFANPFLLFFCCSPHLPTFFCQPLVRICFSLL